MNKLQGFTPKRREQLCRLTFGGILVSLCYGWYARVSFHQMQAPVLRYPYLDPVFWLAHYFSIPETITANFGLALAADLTLIVSAVLAVLFPKKRYPAMIFFCVYLIYFISFNSFGAHHTLSKIGVLLLPIPFMFQQKRFELIWEGMRYYVLLIFTSAFCWKLIRLSWMNPDQGQQILRKNLAPYLLYNAEKGLAALYRALLRSPMLVRFFFLCGFVLEGTFLVGFFTKKFDKLLVLIFSLLVLGFWFFADAFFAELLLFILPFFPALSESGKSMQDKATQGDGAIIT